MGRWRNSLSENRWQTRKTASMLTRMEEKTLQWLHGEIQRFLADVRDVPVSQEVLPAEIREHLLSRYSFEDPVAEGTVLEDVATMLRRWNVHVTHPRYFGYFNPSVTPISIAGDTLTALYNLQLATWSHAPAAAEIERHVLAFFMRRCGLDPSTGFANFTSCGGEANLTAVLVALTHHFPQYGDKGLAEIGVRPVFYCSVGAHDSFGKAAHSVGIGRNALRKVSIDSRLKMDPNALISLIREDKAAGKQPFMVVATAGTTSAGVIDPLPDIAQICRAEDLWLHVDAAWGGGALLSDRLRPALSGIERADSVTWDAHKWLSVPMGAGMFLCKHRQPVLDSFKINTAYMPSSPDDTFDSYSSTIQWSRRFTGLKVFLSLATIGPDKYAAMIEHQTRMGELMRERLTASGWLLLNDTPLPVVNFSHPSINGKTDATRDVCRKILKRGRVWISDVVLCNGRPSLRACVTSYHCSPADIEILITELSRAIGHIQV